MASEAQTAIHELHARGWTDTAIGRAVNRDSSLIHQIATGKKPGTTLRAPLGALAASGAPAPKSAKQIPVGMVPQVRAQRLRQGRERLGERIMGKSGQIHNQGASKELALHVAQRAEGIPGAMIRIVYEVKGPNGEREWRSLNRGGITPAQLREAIHQAVRLGGTWRGALGWLIEHYYRGMGDVGAPTGETGFYIVAQGAA